MENLNGKANLNFWEYVASKYGVQVTYSDSGWKIIYKGNTHYDGEVQVGLVKHQIGLPQDSKQLNTNILAALSIVHNLLWNQFSIDPQLQEKYGAVKVVARRRMSHGR